MREMLLGVLIVAGLLMASWFADVTALVPRAAVATTAPEDADLALDDIGVGLPAAQRTLATPRNDLPGLPNFAEIYDELYRGAQPTAEGFKKLKAMGIKTVVDLRILESDPKLIRGLGLKYVHFSAKAWHPEDGDVIAFLKIVSDPANQPVFVHCQQGSDRTGCMVAAYRMVQQDWSEADAALELRNFGYHPVFTHVARYLDRFDPTVAHAAMRKARTPELRVIE